MEEIGEKSIFGLIALSIGLLLLSVAYFWGYFSDGASKKEGISSPSAVGVLIAFTIYFGIQILISSLLAGWLGNRSEDVTSVVLMTVSGLLITTPLLGWFSLRYKIWSEGGTISLLRILKEAFLLWIIAFPLVLGVHNLLIVFVMYFLGVDYPFHQQVVVESLQQIHSDPYLFWPFVLTVALIVPIAEEILFRGFLQQWLRRYFQDFWSIAIASLVFSLLHFSSSQGISNIAILPPLFILSMLIGLLYLRQKNLWAPIALHALYNTLSICMIEL